MDPKMDPDYQEPDRMKDSESFEDLKNSSNLMDQSPKHRVKISDTTILNGTSTPIKNKYASDEKQFEDIMDHFIQDKSKNAETISEKSHTQAHDPLLKRQMVIDDANKIVSDVMEEAAKRAQNIADQAHSMKENRENHILNRTPEERPTLKSLNDLSLAKNQGEETSSTNSSKDKSSVTHWRENGTNESQDWQMPIQSPVDITSPGSGVHGDIYSIKNESSRNERESNNSDTESDCSPQPRRRSPNLKRRIAGSSSGSDVALHEGAELSPLEDDQESDILQHSEQSFVETASNDMDPECHTRVTKTVRTITTSSSIPLNDIPGTTELAQQESVQKIIDQFISEEKRSQ